MIENGLEKIVGTENMQDTPEVLEAYSRDLSFAPRMTPRCVVKPADASEVQALVRWANETRSTLVPVSSGPPHFRGDTVPRREGAVIADLSRMNRILRVDRKNRVAMIEPGVTFDALVPVLAREGLRLNMPLLPRKQKSVIGSMLEREPVVMPLWQWDAIDPMACMEVIFGTGDPFRTGSAAGPGSLEEQWKSKQAQINPMGPGQTDFARVVQGAQGTMGIVTWTTVRCEAIPSLQKPFLVGADRIEALSDFVYRSLWLKAADTSLLVNRSTLAAMMAEATEDIARLREALPEWLYFFSLAGYEYFPEERVAYQEKDVLEAAEEFGLTPLEDVSGLSADELMAMLAKPSNEPYWKLRGRGGCQEIFFLTTLDRVQTFIDILNDVAEGFGFSAGDIGAYVQPMVQGTSCHCEFDLFYDPNDEKMVENVQAMIKRAGQAIVDAGGYFSRPYGDVSNMVFRNDPDTVAVLTKVKQMFDPANIMNTGRLCFQ